MEVWIGRNGERHGPYQQEQVREWLRSGELRPDDLGWQEGMADWQPLATLFADDLAKVPPPFTPPNVATADVEYAGFWIRVTAYFIDCVVMYIPCTLLGMLFGTQAKQEALLQQTQNMSPDDPATLHALTHFYAGMGGYLLAATLAWWIYSALCESSAWQATVGKLAVGIRVTDLQGKRINLARAVGRYGAQLISAFLFCIGYLMVAFTRRKQGLHDLIASTLVLKGRASEVRRSVPPPKPGDNSTFNA
ncbi:RDD family protein [Dyella acidisoli]|uniref:RDD family protein n=1 Tax=Dyella acidisoli TaxID=1867834 RepID=A0ABQ5XNL8_9GAMM|nr:RDD family protein [Dyella acidisoli]GLQ92952.1 hypothetical protein GCM10007901_19030 [Dyella acidisoli]